MSCRCRDTDVRRCKIDRSGWPAPAKAWLRHETERREARLARLDARPGAEPFDFLAKLDRDEAIAELRAQTFFDTIEEVNAYLEAEDMLDTLEEAKLVISLGAFSPYEVSDEEAWALVADEARGWADEDESILLADLDDESWGEQAFDPEDIQWGFSVRTKDSGRW